MRGKAAILGLGLGLGMALVTPSPSWAAGPTHADYGRPGQPAAIAVGIQPHYAEAWSGIIVQALALWKPRLPAGSVVDFVVAPQGRLLVSQMVAGQLAIAYVGDMPGLLAAGQPHVADIRIAAATGLSDRQCALLLVRPDAPSFAGQGGVAAWLAGRRMAAPHGSCADHFAQALLALGRVTPKAYLNLAAAAIGDAFAEDRIDAAAVWEPFASKLVLDGRARVGLTGADVGQRDVGFVLMRQDLMVQRPDLVRGWIEAEIDAQLMLADPARRAEVIAALLPKTQGFSHPVLERALYGGQEPGGRPYGGMSFPLVAGAEVARVAQASARFLFDRRLLPSPSLRVGAILDLPARAILAERGLKSPLGQVGP